MRARLTIATSTAMLLVAGAATAQAPATWSYDGADEFTADETGALDVTVTVDDPESIRPDLPLKYVHFLVDVDSEPQTGVEVTWSRGEDSGTVTVDGDGGFVLPDDAFTLADTPALTADGETTTLEFALPAGDYVLFSDLADASPPTVRRGGTDRFATAAEVSRTYFPADVDTVFVASGETFADALAAGPAAAAAGGPLLLVSSGTVPDATRAELRRLAPDEIVVAGGPAAVSDDVFRELQPYAGNVRRIGGIDRFDTAARIARDTHPLDGDGVAEAYVANGDSFADALGAAARAAVDGVPVLLVTQNAVPRSTAVTIDVLGISEVTVVGGSAAISPQTYLELQRTAGAASRRSGADRYATSAAVADRSGTHRTLLVATGESFPDALTAGPLAGRLGADLLLTRPTEVPDRVMRRADELAPTRLVGLGGSAVLSDGVLDTIDDARSPLTPLHMQPVTTTGSVEIAVTPT